jgi:hypothetical protein
MAISAAIVADAQAAAMITDVDMTAQFSGSTKAQSSLILAAKRRQFNSPVFPAKESEEVAQTIDGMFEVGLRGLFPSLEFEQILIDGIILQLQRRLAEEQGDLGDRPAVIE